MKLSLEIIKENLTFPLYNSRDSYNNGALHLNRPVLYNGEPALLSNTLYILEKADGHRIQAADDSACIICIGKPDNPLPVRKENGLLLKEGPSLIAVCNAVNEIFQTFDTWESELNTLLIHTDQMTLGDFVNLSESYLENGIGIISPLFKILASGEINEAFGDYDSISGPKTADNMIPNDMISWLKNDSEYQNISDEREVFLYSNKIFPHRALCINCFKNDIYLYRISLTECRRTLRPGDALLLKFLAEHIQIFTEKNHAQSEENPALIAALNDSLQGKPNRQELENEMLKLGWSRDHTFRVICLFPSNEDLRIASQNYYCKEMMSIVSGCFAWSYQNSILVLLNENRNDATDFLSKQLSVFVRENNFRAGVSNPFHVISDLRFYVREAELAHSIGLSAKPMEWIHWFHSITLNYALNKISEDLPLEELLSPVYKRLADYDAENSTDLLYTLYLYLKNDKNAVKTAKELFIHRSTFLYRLGRIAEIGQCHLENETERFHLELSFHLKPVGR